MIKNITNFIMQIIKLKQQWNYIIIKQIINHWGMYNRIINDYIEYWIKVNNIKNTNS